jgi:hypothetical protein
VDDNIYGFVMEETPQKLVVTDITPAKDEMGGCSNQCLLHIPLFYGRRIKVVKIVQADHPLPSSTETGAQMRANKPCPSGY